MLPIKLHVNSWSTMYKVYTSYITALQLIQQSLGSGSPISVSAMFCTDYHSAIFQIKVLHWHSSYMKGMNSNLWVCELVLSPELLHPLMNDRTCTSPQGTYCKLPWINQSIKTSKEIIQWYLPCRWQMIHSLWALKIWYQLGGCMH